MTYDWKVIKATGENLEETLNGVQGYEVFQVLPTLSFTNTKIVMGVSVPLPGEVEYAVVLRKIRPIN